MNRAWRSGTRRRSTKFCSAISATASPGITTVPARERHLQHAAGRRRQHVTLGELLLNHRTFRDARALRIGRHVERRARLVEPRLRRDSLLEQVLGAGQIGLRLRDLRIEPGDLRVERFQLQRELLVTDRGDDLAELDLIALLAPRSRRRCRRCGCAPGTTRRLSTVANTAFSSGDRRSA